MAFLPFVNGSPALNPLEDDVRHTFDLQCEICRKTHLSLYEFACQFTVHREAHVEYRPQYNSIVITQHPPCKTPRNLHRTDRSCQTDAADGLERPESKWPMEVLRKCSVVIQKTEQTRCMTHVNRMSEVTNQAIAQLGLPKVAESFKCSFCSKQYKWQTDLKKHLRDHHMTDFYFGPNLQRSKNMQARKMGFRCPKCPNRRYMWRHDLHKHIKASHPNYARALNINPTPAGKIKRKTNSGFQNTTVSLLKEKTTIISKRSVTVQEQKAGSGERVDQWWAGTEGASRSHSPASDLSKFETDKSDFSGVAKILSRNSSFSSGLNFDEKTPLLQINGKLTKIHY